MLLAVGQSWRASRGSVDFPRTLLMVGLGATMAASTVLPTMLASRRLSLAYLDFSPYTFATLLFVVVLVAVTIRAKAEV